MSDPVAQKLETAQQDRNFFPAVRDIESSRNPIGFYGAAELDSGEGADAPSAGNRFQGQCGGKAGDIKLEASRRFRGKFPVDGVCRLPRKFRRVQPQNRGASPFGRQRGTERYRTGMREAAAQRMQKSPLSAFLRKQFHKKWLQGGIRGKRDASAT